MPLSFKRRTAIVRIPSIAPACRDRPLRVRFGPFAKPPVYDRYLRIPAEDPRRIGSDSGHLVADPIGHQVRFLPLGVP
jgi:hypothetical protein